MGDTTGPEDRGGSGEETVLVVDDDDAIRALLREVLEAEGYLVLEATDGLDACERFAQRPGEVHLVLLDMKMPRLGGADTLARLRDIDAEVRVLISTGYSHDDAFRRALKLGAQGILPKPYRIEDLLTAVRQAIELPAGARAEPPSER
jgi:CheY-like chemotaxis protein